MPQTDGRMIPQRRSSGRDNVPDLSPRATLAILYAALGAMVILLDPKTGDEIARCADARELAALLRDYPYARIAYAGDGGATVLPAALVGPHNVP